MDYGSALILGIVEGITEFLPISSTGHLLIAEHLMRSHRSDAFNVVIQVGPIVAVSLVFWKDILHLFTHLDDARIRDEFFKLSACFILTGIAGFTAKKLGLSLPDTVFPIAAATIIGGGVILWTERRVKGKILRDSMTWTAVVAVAAGQILAAVFPGTSRSGAAVMAGLLLGLSRPFAVRTAFLVGIPTMIAAGALQIREAVDAGHAAELLTPQSITAFIAATATAWLAVVWLLRFIQRSTFTPFAWYRLVFGVALVLLVAAGAMK